MNDNAIEMIDLSKTYSGGVDAVNGLNLAVPRGAVCGLIGRNAAGKSTAIRMLMGVLNADRGSARVLGFEFKRATCQERARVAYVSQDARLPGWMSFTKLCRYCASFYERWDQRLADEIAKRAELPFARPIETLSGGQRRRVATILAFASQADVLVLDEPAAGLDPLSRSELIGDIVDALSRRDGCTVLFSTHIIADLERVADHVAVMTRGRITTHRPIDEFRESRRIQLVFPGDHIPDEVVIPHATRTQRDGPVLQAVVSAIDEQYVAGVAEKYGARAQTFPVGLEDALIELIGADGKESA